MIQLELYLRRVRVSESTGKLPFQLIIHSLSTYSLNSRLKDAEKFSQCKSRVPISQFKYVTKPFPRARNHRRNRPGISRSYPISSTRDASGASEFRVPANGLASRLSAQCPIVPPSPTIQLLATLLPFRCLLFHGATT